MAASKTTSKTSAKATRSTTKQRAVPAADIDRLVGLSHGKFAYLYYPNGSIKKLRTTSEEFVAAVREVSAMGFGQRIYSQVDRLASVETSSHWPQVKELLDSTGACGL